MNRRASPESLPSGAVTARGCSVEGALENEAVDLTTFSASAFASVVILFPLRGWQDHLAKLPGFSQRDWRRER